MSVIDSLNINSLKFFTGDGKQILMQKQYSVSWEIRPADCIASAFIRNPKGHFECDLSTDITDDSFRTNTYDATVNLYTTDFISFVDYTLYEADLPKSTRILFYDIDKNFLSGETITVSDDGPVKFCEKESSKAVWFKFGFPFKNTASEYEFLSLKKLNAEAFNIVDEPGLIQSTVQFNSKSVDSSKSGYNRLVGYKHDIVPEKPNISKYKPSYKTFTPSTFSREITLTNIYDIIFFDYEYRVDKYSEPKRISNTILITITDGKTTASEEYPLYDFFSTTEQKADTNLSNLTVSKCNATNGNNDSYLYGVLSSLFTYVLFCDQRTDFDIEEKSYAGKQTSAFYAINSNLDESSFPYMKYIGTYWQEKVSTDFIASDTLIVVNDNFQNGVSVTGANRYTYPRLGTQNNEFRFHFRFQPNSEMFFVIPDENGYVEKFQDYYPLTYSEKLQTNASGDNPNPTLENECVNAVVGFTSPTEGCYKNVMGIFLADYQAQKEYFIGAINWMSETEDEDERFRTLFGNFGVPDPVTYPNVFKSQNPDEEGTDWRVINAKSKELFLYYDQIFPYSGTYKALFNAMRFLGYTDIIFKEWYRIKDTTDQWRQIALQNYDYNSQKSIPNILKKYGINFGEYDRYTKLNRLSMIYHLQRIDEESEENLPMYDTNGLQVPQDIYDPEDIETVINLYEYRADEVLAKLFSVKQWLERYITGVNCYISDITGEYIVIERLKTLSYATQYEIKDITKEGYFTPKCYQKESNVFKDSSAIITCSLTEFGDHSITFEDIQHYRLTDFIRREHTVKNNKGQDITIYESAPFGAVTIGEEFQYKLELNTDCGSLYEFSKTLDNPILVKENEIVFWNQKLRVSEIDEKELPVIQIKKGNIRQTTGSWSADSGKTSNVLFSIYTVNDFENDVTYCILRDIKNPERYIRCKGLVNFSPVYDNSGNTKCTLKYSADNKWELPLLFFSGYKITNEFAGDKHNPEVKIHADDIFPESTEEYILEIIEGDIKFADREDFGTSEENTCSTAQIIFWEDANEASSEQRIEMRYEYESDRIPIYEFASENLNRLAGLSDRDMMKKVDELISINSETEVPVNRIGEYTVVVTAFDAYNNAYVNKGDDKCEICAARPDICIIVNKDESDNIPDFYKANINYKDSSVNSSIITLYDAIKENLYSRIDDNPVFPMTYKIYSDEHKDDDEDSIYYDSISYAIDTPKKNDYLVMTNMTERANITSISSSSISLELKSSNLFKQNLFAVGSKLNLCVFDDNLQKSLYSSENTFTVTSCNIVSENGQFISGRVTVANDNGNDLSVLISLKDSINSDNNVNLYLINATECVIPETKGILNWTDDEGNRRVYIPINEHSTSHKDNSIDDYEENYSEDLYLREFPLDTIIKISAYHKNKEGIKDIIGECAYRVIDTSIVSYIDNRSPEKNDISTCGYILDGWVDFRHIMEAHNDTCLDTQFEPSVLETVNGESVRTTDFKSDMTIYGREELEFCMKPVHEKPIQYYLRVDADADEMTYMYDKAGFYGILTKVDYNPMQLLFNSYFDDSYAFSCFKFDPQCLNEIWFKPESEDYYRVNNTESSQTDLRKLFMFRNYPISVLQNSEIVVKTDDDLPTLKGAGTDECVKLWRWKVKALEDKSNWRNVETNIGDITLFESVNDVLSVRPYMLGSQSIELYCYDKYGNCVKNTGGGNIYVMQDSYVDYKEMIQRNSFLREI